MPNVVLDSYAALAFLFGEEGADAVEALFEQSAGVDHYILPLPTGRR